MYRNTWLFTLFLGIDCFSINNAITTLKTIEEDYDNTTIKVGNVTKIVSCLKLTSSTSCYYELPEDDLPRADDRNTKFPEDSIFFLETSCKGGLDERQACSVESAARAHPNRSIVVLFAGPVAKACLEVNPIAILLKTYHNIELSRIHIEKYSKGTPLEKLLKSRIFKRSRFPIHHTSDVLRYLTLYKFGGIYLDLDMIVLKSFDLLPESKNFVGKDQDTTIAAGIIGFSKGMLGRKMAKEAMRILRKKFNPFMHYYNSVGVIKDALLHICTNSEVTKMLAAACQGFEVYEPDYFYPVGYEEYKDYFRPGRIDLTGAYTAHLWNALAGNITPEAKSPYTFLSKKYCPRVSQMFNPAKFTEVKRTEMDALAFYYKPAAKEEGKKNSQEHLDLT